MSKFKLPSFESIIASANKSLMRFPLVIAAGLVVTICAIIMNNDASESELLLPTLLTAAYAIPLLFAVKMFIESRQIAFPEQLAVYGVGALILVGIFILLPKDQMQSGLATRYLMYVFFFVSIVMVVTYIAKLNNNGFWQYNKSWISRLLISVLYTSILLGAICGAFLSIETLFNVEMPNDFYFNLFAIFAGLVFTWIFVGGIKSNINEFDTKVSYPNALKIFGQYILLPISIIYCGILYVYFFKVLVSWDWPKGLVCYLVIGVAVVNYITQIILFPYEKDSDWIGFIRRALVMAIIPLTFMLFMAIGMRISAYGFTINRYLIFVLGIWLLLISIFNALKIDYIKSLPISFSVLAVLVAIGPWSAFKVSERQQMNRLKNILTEAGLFDEQSQLVTQEYYYNTNNTFDDTNLDIELSDSMFYAARDILDYLNKFHNPKRLNSWFKQDVVAFAAQKNISNLGKVLSNILRLEKYRKDTSVIGYKSFSVSQSDLMNIKGYSLAKAIELHKSDYKYKSSHFFKKSMEHDGKLFYYYLMGEPNSLVIENEEKQVVEFDFRKTIEVLDNMSSMEEHNDVEPSLLTLKQFSEQMDCKLLISELSYDLIDNDFSTLKIRYLQGVLLLNFN